MWFKYLYRTDIRPLSDRSADIPTSYRYLSDIGMLIRRSLASQLPAFHELGNTYMYILLCTCRVHENVMPKNKKTKDKKKTDQ